LGIHNTTNPPPVQIIFFVLENSVKKVKALLKFRDASLKKGLMFFEKGLTFFSHYFLRAFNHVNLQETRQAGDAAK
jgi:hypothetical protein